MKLGGIMHEIERISTARQELEKAETIEEIHDFHSKAEALRKYAKQSGMKLIDQNEAAKLRIRAEWLGGEILDEMERAQGLRTDLTSAGHQPKSFRQQLKEIPMSRWQSQSWSLEHSLSWEDIETYFAKMDEAEKEITSADIIRMARKLQQVEVEPPPLPEGKYNVIYADPPWRYDFSPTDSRKIENQYPTMSLENIKELADRDDWPVADDAVLFLWATAPKLRENFEVMDYWGFEYKTHAVWDKEIPGMGFWWRGQHEMLFTGVKGSFSPPAEEARVGSVIRHKREDHSRKPRFICGIIEKMFPKAKGIELFSRDKYSDYWEVWGYEAYVN
jgi:N6-adenosine-specific RNA methylase IME4